jgi:hyperosmotically inducible protein
MNGNIMKKAMIAVCLLTFLQPTLLGCGTAYKVAMDQRDVSTQFEDEKITMAIRDDVMEDSDLNLMDMSVYCYKGRVYLVGEYDKIFQKDRVVKIAKEVKGVKSVRAHFLKKRKADLCGATDNLKFKAKVKAKLIGDEDISSTNIEVKSLQCQIVLLGLVGSNSQIREAIAHAKSVEGIRSVKSFLQVARQ